MTPDETAARLVEDIEEHLLFQHDTPDEGEALLQRCLQLLAPEALTPEEWDIVEDGMIDLVANSEQAAEMWAGRGREARYRAEVTRYQAVLDKLRRHRPVGTEGK